jgi:hypothetical protein
MKPSDGDFGTVYDLGDFSLDRGGLIELEA